MATRYQISVILTDECNMRCKYCTTAKRAVDISSAMVQRVVELLARTAPAPLDLNFHGGEPTLVWDRVVELTERVEASAGGRRLSLNICTNGTMMSPERARFLADHDFNVRVSIDGRKNSHTRFRLPDGAHKLERALALYDDSFTGLGNLIDAGARTAVNMVVTPDTVGELLSNAVFLIKQGLVHLVVSPVVGMPWEGEHLLVLDQQLRQMVHVWQRWMERHPEQEHENLRRAIVSEIDRATYCIGERMNMPDARVFVIGPSGRIFGDEPEARTEEALVLGHVNDVESLEDLPALPRTAFQLMYDREFYAPHVLRDVRRTHRLLRKRMVELHRQLFGAEPATGGAALAGDTNIP